jgi:hypothetical protein
MNPEARIKAYLEMNRGKLQLASDLSAVIADVKLYVFHDVAPIPDDEIRKIVVQWASFNAIGLLHKISPGGAPAAPATGATTPPTSEFLDGVKKVIKTINNGVTFGPEKGNNLAFKVTGATLNLKSGDKSLSTGVSWSGVLKVEAESGPLHFAGTLSEAQWQMTLTFPQDTAIPDLSSVTTIFSRGEKTVRNLAAAAWDLNDVSDSPRIGAMVKPDIDAVQDAVEAAAGIAAAPKDGGVSFGFKVGSPQPGPGQQGIPGGIEASLVFTWVF